MAKTKISEFSTTPGNNTDINGINIAEGCAPSGINNAIRELMSDLKEWQSGAMDVYVIPQGTAAAPGIQLYGDLDTGLYGYAANQLGVAVGGASAGYFSSTGWNGNVNGTITGDINATTIDTTNLEVTNIKAKDGTAAITIADSTGIVSVSTQLAVDNLNLSVNTISSSDTNGNIILAPNGTGDVYLDADTIRVGDSNTNVTITSNGTADLILNTNSGTNSGSITIQDGVNGNILIATNGTGQIQLTGDLDVANVETGAIKARDGTASATIANSTGVMTIASSVLTTTDINGGTIDGTVIGGSTTAAGSFTTVTATQLDVDNLRFDANTISSTNTNGNIQIAPAGTGDVYLDADTVRIGDLNSDATLTTNGTADLILNTNSGSLSGSITIQDGVNGNILIAPNGTGQIQLSGALDVTNIEVTNIKAKDGTAALSIADSTGAVTVATALTANGGAVFNENGANVDFRVEGDTDANLIFADASADAVGIGTNAPAAKLQVVSNTPLRLNNSGATSQADLYFADSGATLKIENFFGTGSALSFGTNANGAGVLERMRLTSTGTLNIVGAGTAGSTQAVSINGSTPVNTLVTTTTGVGIGTDTPGQKLAVVATSGDLAQFQNSVSYGTVLQVNATATGGRNWKIHATANGDGVVGGGFFSIIDATANAYRLNLDSSGNLGIGTNSPTSKFAVSNGTNRLEVAPGASNVVLQALNEARTATTELLSAGSILTYWTGAAGSQTERARFTSGGSLLVAKNSSDASVYGFEARASGVPCVVTNTNSNACYFNRQADDGAVVNFARGNSTVGSVSVTTTATAYNTSSDYRLKDNQQPLTGSGAFIDALQPKTWDWKTGGKGVGFIAHEVQAVSPGSVTGEKDAVDAEGNPIMQAMEYGSAEFIANIIAELQSLRARVAQLEGK